MLRLFEEVDAILAPATPISAPLIGQKTFLLDGVETPLRPNIGLYTQPISFIGLPVVAAPVERPRGLPIGVQIIGAFLNDRTTIAFAGWCDPEAAPVR